MTRLLSILILCLAAGCGHTITGAQSTAQEGVRIVYEGDRRTIEVGKASTEKGGDYSGPANSAVKQDEDGNFTVKPKTEPFKNAKYLGGIFLLVGGIIAYLSGRKTHLMGVALGLGIVGMGILAFLMPGLLVLLAVAAVGLAAWAVIDLWKHKNAQATETALAQTVAGVDNALINSTPIIAREVLSRLSEKMDSATKAKIRKVKGA